MSLWYTSATTIWLKGVSSGMDSRITKEQVFVISYFNLNNMVKEFFGRDWEFIADEEARNDHVYRFTITGKYMSKYYWDWLHRWVLGEKRKYLTQDILTAMAVVGHIPMGTYIIEVSW